MSKNSELFRLLTEAIQVGLLNNLLYIRSQIHKTPHIVRGFVYASN